MQTNRTGIFLLSWGNQWKYVLKTIWYFIRYMSCGGEQIFHSFAIFLRKNEIISAKMDEECLRVICLNKVKWAGRSIWCGWHLIKIQLQNWYKYKFKKSYKYKKAKYKNYEECLRVISLNTTKWTGRSTWCGWRLIKIQFQNWYKYKLYKLY